MPAVPPPARPTVPARAPAAGSPEILALERLVRLAGAAVDAHARRIAAEPEPGARAELDGRLEARRRLFADLVRCLLLRGVPPARVTGLLRETLAATEAPRPPADPDDATGPADRRLLAAIEVAFARRRPSPAVAEMLGLHYLRLTGDRGRRSRAVPPAAIDGGRRPGLHPS